MLKKRLLASALVVLTITSMMSGCGKQGDDVSSEIKQSSEVKTEEKTDADQSAETSQSEELEEKTIQVWLYGPGKQKDSDEVWEVFNEKLQEYVPNTTVEFTVMAAEEYKEKYSQMLAAGEPVDLVWSAGWVTGRSQDEEAKDGNILPLDDLLDKYGQGIKEALGDTILDIHRYSDGKLYYIISWQGLFGNAFGVRIPSELADLAGENWTEETQAAFDKYYDEDSSLENYQAIFDQFDKYLAACKNAGKIYAGFANNTFLDWGLETLCEAGGTTYINYVGLKKNDNTFKVEDFIATDRYRLLVKNIADFYKKGYVRSDIASAEGLGFVKNGEYGSNTQIMYTHYLLTDTQKETFAKEAGVDLDFITVREEGTYGKGTSTSMVIPYCADDPERAMMVYNAIYTVPELYQLLVYGIEGVHYTDNGDGTITTPYNGNPSADSDYGQFKWVFGTCKNSLVSQTDVKGYYDQLIEKEKTAYVSPFMNFTFDKTNVADICAALSAIDQEYKEIIQYGYMGDESEAILDKWIAERKAAGVDKLIEEFQKQIDAHIEANKVTSW